MDSSMPKTIKHIFYEKLDFLPFLNAHQRAKKSKGSKDEVILFEIDLESNLVNLMREIKECRYQMGEYREFVVSYPKERLIKSLPYRDRIVHQWYVEEFIKPYFLPRFIKDSYACIEEKGNHKAVLVLQKYMRIMKRKYGSYYILKCDIKKFFYTIDRGILLDILKKDIKDRNLLEFTKVLLLSKDNGSVGIPIGNYTSQFFANIYLNELDHYLKEKMRVKYYVRYMDDFVLLLKDKKEDKKEAFFLYKVISSFLHEKLHLALNEKSVYFPNRLGVDFCGYKVYETHILVRKRCKSDMKRKVKLWNHLFISNTLDIKKTTMSFHSWMAHCSHANSYYLVREVERKLLFKIK